MKGDEMRKKSKEEQTLLSLCEVSGKLNRILDVHKLLEEILNEVVDIFSVERALVILMEKDRLEVKVARHIDSLTSEDVLSYSKSIVNTVIENVAPIFCSNAQDDTMYKDRKSIKCLKIYSFICVPLIVERRVIGTIYVDDRKRGNAFTDSDADYLKAFAGLAAVAIYNARLHEDLVRENMSLKKRTLDQNRRFPEIIGESLSMQKVYQVMACLLDNSSNVLIEGESGTGKELIARTIHNHSLRSDQPFMPIDCGAIPEHLIESELFGHVKGAFTGADSSRMGFFEAANGGTVFLDEVSNTQRPFQAKLLRVLQELEVRRVGENVRRKVNIRIITASNRDLRHLIKEGLFREDLFYRLNTVCVKIPPLREREEDVALLAEYFLKKYSRKFEKRFRGIPENILRRLQAYAWPGNVRELEQEIKKMVILCRQDGQLTPDLLSDHFHLLSAESGGDGDSAYARNLQRDVSKYEVGLIQRALILHEWNISRAARSLGISRQNLQKKIKRFRLENPFGNKPGRDAGTQLS
jgi:Nif-specific regulatory protein